MWVWLCLTSTSHLFTLHNKKNALKLTTVNRQPKRTQTKCRETLKLKVKVGVEDNFSQMKMSGWKLRMHALSVEHSANRCQLTELWGTVVRFERIRRWESRLMPRRELRLRITVSTHSVHVSHQYCVYIQRFVSGTNLVLHNRCMNSMKHKY